MKSVLSSLGYRNFRLYFEGQCVSVIGTWIQQIAMGWLAYKLTGSVLILATVTFMEQIPMLLITPFASVFVDRFNRHKLLIITQTLSMLQALVMALLIHTDTIAVWSLLLLSSFMGFVNALDMPTRQAFYTSLVPHESLPNAIALNSAVINGCRLIGPAVGGVLIAWVGEGMCFLINGLSYIGVIIALLMMKMGPHKSPSGHARVLSDMKEGFEYVKGNVPIKSLLMMMAALSFFGVPFNSFLPAYVGIMLDGDSETLGLLLSFVGIGAFIASVCLAMRKSIVGMGRMILYSSMIMGCSLILISFVKIWWLAAALCIPIGFSIITSVASMNTLLQTLSDNRVRGRVMGYLVMAFAGMPPLGGLLLGTMEKSSGLPLVLVVEGAGCLMAGAAFFYYRPVIKRHISPVLDFL